MTTLVLNSSIHIFKFRNTYVFHNLLNSMSLNIVINEMECGSHLKLFKEFVLSPSENKVIKFHYDGDFQITRISPDEDYGTFSIYDKTLSNVIERTKNLLCGCGCTDCEDCDDNSSGCEETLLLYSLMTSYYASTFPKYKNYLEVIFKSLKCHISSDMLCQIHTEMIQGKSEASLFLKKTVAYYYLAFYLLESFLTSDAEEAYEVNKKFKYSEIIKCIKKLGINPKDIIEELMSGIEVKYWQFTSIVPTMATVVASWTSTYLDTLPGIDVRPLEDFEQGVTVPYTNIGRIGFAIYKTDLLNFTLYDSLGNDVTDNFDVHHFASDETVVFVSKLPYSHSNIYFKFKKNIYA